MRIHPHASRHELAASTLSRERTRCEMIVNRMEKQNGGEGGGSGGGWRGKEGREGMMIDG